MDIEKEREVFDKWVLTHPDNLDLTAYEENIMFDAWLAAKQRAVPDGFVVVPVEPTKNIVDKLEDIASCQPSYGGDDIYKVAIGVLDYDWKSGLKAMIQEAQR